jgi:dipeptidyl aminopeptidase/acylaminoacyl peptidase
MRGVRRAVWILAAFLCFLFPAAAEEVPSLAALMQKEYDGHGFSVQQVLFSDQYYTCYQIAYKGDGLTISGVMNLPKGKGPFPVLILNHGYINPKYYTLGRGLKREQDYLAKQGYIVIHPDYRNHAFSDKDPDDTAGFRLGYVVDAINCIMAVKRSDKKYFDKDRIGLLGHSMGGGVVLNVLVAKPELAKAAVLFAPLSADYRDNFRHWLWRRKRNPEVAEKIISRYGSPESNPEFWDGLSAINYFENVKTPVMIHHGTADKSVPVEWSDRTAAALSAEGKSVVYYKYPGGRHEFTVFWPRVMRRTAEFFNKHLK